MIRKEMPHSSGEWPAGSHGRKAGFPLPSAEWFFGVVAVVAVVGAVAQQGSNGFSSSTAPGSGFRSAPPARRMPKRLDHWRFEGRTLAAMLSSERGLLPLRTNKIHLVASLDGKGVRIDEMGASLKYPERTPSGTPTVSCGNGTVKFWFKPGWTSGEGPGNYGSFFSVGQWTPDPPSIGFWGLNIDPAGRVLSFGGQTNGAGTTFITAPVHLVSNQWHQIVVAYSPTNSYIYLDGRRFGPGKGVSYFPGPGARMVHGLDIGNNHVASQPIHGVIDDFETLSYPITGLDLAKKPHVLSAQAFDSPPRVRLTWERQGGQVFRVRRRRHGYRQWHDLARGIRGTAFSDRDPGLRTGRLYDYEVGHRRITVGLKAPPKEDRGKVILFVADYLKRRLSREIKRFERDLAGDGWEVIRLSAPAHSERRWSLNRRRVKRVKSMIGELYHVDPLATKTIVLLGHVAIPYSGFAAEDGHTRKGDDHRGAWPCDAYYGDVDGEWTDQNQNFVNRTIPQDTNIPGDGKFDQDFLPSPLELAVGRIDFANLPSVVPSGPGGRRRRGLDKETSLLRDYLEKDHRYRIGDLRFPPTASVKSYLPPALSANIIANGFRNASRWFGSSPDQVSEGDCFSGHEATCWAFLAAYGGSESLASGRYRTRYIRNLADRVSVGFFMLYASWIADWNLTDSFSRALLTLPRAGLVSMSSLQGQWRLGELGLGEPLATGYLRTVNEAFRPRKQRRSIALLGDPTLRLQVTAPVQAVSGSEKPGNEVWLHWRPPEGPPNHYYVYRGGSDAGPFYRISGRSPLSQSEFKDSSPSENEPIYMVRAAELVSTGSGSFTNLSHGVMWRRN